MKKLAAILVIGMSVSVMSHCKKENNHEELMLTLVGVLSTNGTVYFQNNAGATRAFSLHSDTCSTSNSLGTVSVTPGQTGSLTHAQLVSFYVGSNVGQAGAKCTSSSLMMRFPTVVYSCVLSAADALSCNSL